MKKKNQNYVLVITNIVLAQNQNAVHVIQIGNTFYDVIPITNPSASVTRCHHHSHCRRGFHIHSDSNSSLNANAHTNPTFILDEGIYPSAPNIEAPPPPYEDVIRLPQQYPKLSNSAAATPISEIPPPTIAEIEGNSITTITSLSRQQRSTPHQTSVT